MKKSILTTLAIFTATFFTLADAQTLDEVLAKHFKATGQEKLSNVKTVLYKAKINQTGMDEPMTLTFQIKNPEKFYSETNIQGKKMITAFDGENGWMINPWMSADPQDLSGEQLRQAQPQGVLEDKLWNYEEKGHMVELIGKVIEDDKEYFHLKLTSEDGDVMNYFLDPETYLVAKVKFNVDAMGQTIENEQCMMDYKDIDGIKMAMKIETVVKDSEGNSLVGTGVITIEELKFNVDIDDAIFTRPGK
jgi:outer membrane lipoprotein-sorting protein